MAKARTNQKMQRTLALLMGMRDARVVQALSEFGFTERDQQEGLDLVQALISARMRPSEQPVEEPDAMESLRAFAGRWFGVARHTLVRHHPELVRAVFADLVQGGGKEVAITVRLFLDRLRDLEAGAHGASGIAARELLARRGITAEVIAAGHAEVARFGRLRRALPVRDWAPAERAMWAWYLEWSGIARSTIRDKQLLRLLGFRKPRSGEPEENASAVAATPADPATNVAQLPLGGSGSTRS